MSSYNNKLSDQDSITKQLSSGRHLRFNKKMQTDITSVKSKVLKSLKSREDYQEFASQLELALSEVKRIREREEESESMMTSNLDRCTSYRSFRSQDLQELIGPCTPPAKIKEEKKMEKDVSKQLARIQSTLNLRTTVIRKDGEKAKWSLATKRQDLNKQNTTKIKFRKRRSILRKIEYLLPANLLNKTEVCKHAHGCFENVVRKALKNFLIGFFLQIMLRNLVHMGKPRQFLKMLRRGSTMLDGTRFGLFLMCFNTAYKLVLCLMRRMGCTDQINAPVAGLLSGLTLAMDSGNRRQLLTMVALSRAIECSLSIGEANDYVPKVRNRDWILWLSMNMFLLTAMNFKQQILTKGMRNFFTRIAKMTPNEVIMINTQHRMMANSVAAF